jgi:hypothetical protein
MAEFILLPLRDIYGEFLPLVLDHFTKPVLEESRTRMVNNHDAVGPVLTGNPD